MLDELVLSELSKTWLIDIDGVIFKHNGYLLDGHDTLLPGSKDFINGLSKGDKVILLTAREEAMREETESFLIDQGVRYDSILFGLPTGERIIVNDMKPSGLQTSKAVNLSRDVGIKMKVVIDKNL